MNLLQSNKTTYRRVRETYKTAIKNTHMKQGRENLAYAFEKLPYGMFCLERRKIYMVRLNSVCKTLLIVKVVKWCFFFLPVLGNILKIILGFFLLIHIIPKLGC